MKGPNELWQPKNAVYFLNEFQFQFFFCQLGWFVLQFFWWLLFFFHNVFKRGFGKSFFMRNIFRGGAKKRFRRKQSDEERKEKNNEEQVN